MNIISSITVFIIITIIYTSIRKNNQIVEIGLIRAYGVKARQTILLLVLEMIIPLAFSIVSGFIISLIVLTNANILMNLPGVLLAPFVINYNTVVSFTILILIIFASIVISVISSIFITKTNISVILKSRNT